MHASSSHVCAAACPFIVPGLSSLNMTPAELVLAYSAAAEGVLQQHAQPLCPCSCRYQDHGFEAASVYAFEGLDTGHVSPNSLLLIVLYSFDRCVELRADTQIRPGCVCGRAMQIPWGHPSTAAAAKAALAGCIAQAQRCTGLQMFCTPQVLRQDTRQAAPAALQALSAPLPLP